MANIYSGMTSAQKDNERKYLNNLVSGGGGNAEWAKGQLKQLDASSSSSSNTTSSNKSSGVSSMYKNNSSSSSSSSNSILDKMMDNVKNNPISSGGSSSNVNKTNSGWYVPSGSTNKPVVEEVEEVEEIENPYEAELAELRAYKDRQEALIKEQNRLAVEQGVNRLQAQKSGINQNAEDNARQAYIMHMQAKKALPQQLASQGITGGATETANLGLQTTYQNNVNTINQNRANALQDIDNAIVELKNTGDLSTVEQVLANNQAALDAYMNNLDKQVGYNQWAQQFNANREDTMAEQAYRDKVYADQMAQQTLENQWYEQSYNDAQKKEETNRIITLLENGMYNPETASALLGVPTSQLENFVNYINRARNLELNNTQSLINNRNSGSGGGSGNVKESKTESVSDKYYNLATQINNQYFANATGKNAGDAVIVDNGTGGYMINPDISRSSYLDLVIARAFDSDMSDNEVKTFLKNLGISDNDISRVAAYYLKEE